MKGSWKDYFSFNKKERVAVIGLLLLIAVFIALPYFFQVSSQLPVIDPALKEFVEKNGVTGDSAATGKPLPYPDEKSGTGKTALFRFDPNTIDLEGWIRLGLKPKTAQTILNYRNKGGKFRTPDDLRKIWGIAKTEAERLIPYAMVTTGPDAFQYTQKNRVINAQPGKTGVVSPIDINIASLAEWEQLPGIGEVLANRILNYREKANGFSGIGQVKKVYGISDSVFGLILPFLQVNPATLKKLNLNTVTHGALAERTGISTEVARAIIVFRQQYGPYGSVEDLQKIVFISDSLLARIRPFVTVQ